MVANEGLEKAEPIETDPLGPTALHPLRRMQCELFQAKHLQEHTYLFAESTPRREKISYGKSGTQTSNLSISS